MNLEENDLPVDASESNFYPIEMVRAIAVVCCFAALRSDEIQRLRIGCLRWQHEDVMIPETGTILPKDATCFLDILVNKTSSEYTKPVHPLVGKRIAEWERVRPTEQLREVCQRPLTWLSQLCGEQVVIVAKSATLHYKSAMEVAGNANNPTHFVARGLRHHRCE